MPHRLHTYAVELGHQPPLTLGGRVGEPPAKGRISSRWLAGTVLTGLAGASLMYVTATNTLDRETSAIEKPQLIKPREQTGHLAGDLIVAGRKGERLIQRAEIISARQVFKTPMIRREQGGEVVRQASFTRVATPLAQDTLGFADVVPKYNVARLVADASEDRALEGPPPGSVDSDVGLTTRNIDEVNYPTSRLELHEDEALAQATEALAVSRRTAPSLPAQMLLAKAMRAPNDYGTMNFAGPGREPFSRLVVRMVPENVSVFPRIEAALARNTLEQRALLIKSEDNAEQILRTLGLSVPQAKEAVRTLSRAGGGMADNRRLKVTLQALEQGAPRSVVRVELYSEETRVASVGRRDDGVFVLFEIEKRTPPRRATTTGDEEEGEGGFTLFQSIHETGRKHNVPTAMIDDIIRVLFFDVDLQRAVGAGDSMELLMSNDDSDQPGELMMLSVTIGGDVRRFYRFPVPEDEVVDYFDDQGRSAKKFLIRKPIAEGELRSTFGSRRHPILGYYRMHNGVDWAARMGTPILSAGNGTVRFADWSSGYGRRVEVQHTNGYVTTYNHMSGFGPKITEGVRVRQGQVVGYLGSTGLSTGPHLHYEVMINERHVDPLAIKLPRGRELEGPQLAEFKKMRDQTEAIIKKAPGGTASLAPTAAAKPGG